MKHEDKKTLGIEGNHSDKVMKTMGICCSILILFVLLGSNASAEPPKKPDVSFALAFDCGGGPTTIPVEERCEGRCVNRAFKAGVNVVLIAKDGITSARTAATCTYAYPVDGLDKATRLTEDEKRQDDDFLMTLAVVRVDASAVGLVSEKVDDLALPKEIELKARQLLKPRVGDLCDRSASTVPPLTMADSPPKIIRVHHVALLKFATTDPDLNPDQGPSVLLMNDEVFRLCGACTSDHLFFSVNDRLYLSSWIGYFRCGERVFVVYDLSGEEPRVVYENFDFSP